MPTEVGYGTAYAKSTRKSPLGETGLTLKALTGDDTSLAREEWVDWCIGEHGMSDMDNIVGEFLVESHEGLDQLDRDLVSLEQHQTDQLLASVFRCIHTIKGTCGFLGFSRLESVTHIGENLLSKLRDRELALNSEITTGLLSMVDAVRSMLHSIEKTGADGDEDYSALIATLEDLSEGSRSRRKKVTASRAKSKAGAGSKARSPVVKKKKPVRKRKKAVMAKSTKKVRISKSTKELEFLPVETTEAVAPVDEGVDPNLMGDLFVERGLVQSEDVDRAIETQDTGDPRHVGEILVEQGQLESQDVLETLQVQQEAGGRSASDGSIRVDVELLDKLMNLVGELVLSRNQILQFATTQEDRTFLSTTQRLNLITTELQEGVMKTRMQPINNVWSRFPRVVRDLATAGGKQIRIEMEGKDTEIDKSIIEAIKDPLTHIIRNSADHGIEKPEQRVAAGKAEQGLLFLRAFHEGGQVNIEISDDGAGIDPAKIKAKALERGLISPDRAKDMSDREAINLVFRPGLSLAERVTSVSGRGVGMDVVKTNIEKIGGTVDIQSKIGEGTIIKLKIPLTLAIIPGLIVKAGGDRYAIPQVSLLELVRLEGEQAEKGIEMVQDAPVYRLRGKLLPLVYLSSELHTGNGDSSDDQEIIVNIVVLQADERQFGLVVDEILDTEEIVVKPLSKQLKDIQAFAGVSVMGDGKVALILDVLGLAQRAKVLKEVSERTITDVDQARAAAKDDSHTLLIIGLGETGRLAVPLTKVARLEDIAADSVEYAGHESVVQYRGEIMPLIWLAQELNYQAGDGTERPDRLLVVVCVYEGQSIGLVVDHILDIVEESVTIDKKKSTNGLFGSDVINGHVTDFLDVEGVLENHMRMEKSLAASAIDFRNIKPTVEIEEGNGQPPTVKVRIPLGPVVAEPASQRPDQLGDHDV